MIRDPQKQFPRAVNYQNIRSGLGAGNLVIFGAQYRLSKLIRLWTKFPASHAASIIRDDEDRICFVEASEGDMYPEREGGIVSYFSNSMPFCKGDFWIARLSETTRKRLDATKFKKILKEQVGKGYDYKDMKKAGFDFFDSWGITKNTENLSKMFCLELVAAANKHVGILPEDVNPSEYSPGDIVKLNIFDPVYYQFKAYNYKAVKLPEYNSIPLASL